MPVFEPNQKKYTKEFYQYIQDALDLIELANGSPESKWGSIRCRMGHPASFNLKMLGIGNEQWEQSSVDYFRRYKVFETEIHNIYPNIKLIFSAGPNPDGEEFDAAWNWIECVCCNNDNFTYAVDEHFYRAPEWFLDNAGRYDKYERNIKVFAGEYAAHTKLTKNPMQKNNLEAALAEAAFMTGMEKMPMLCVWQHTRRYWQR